MTRALIAFATRHGQTERVALRMAKIFTDAGTEVDLLDLRRLKRPPWPADYDLVVIAGSVHFGKHPRELERFVCRYRGALDCVESVLVSVSGAAISEEGRAEAEGYVTALTRRTGWSPGRSLLAGGAIRYTQYNPLLRWMMRRLSATHGRGTDTTRDYEYTDWRKVDQFAQAIVPSAAEALSS